VLDVFCVCLIYLNVCVCYPYFSYSRLITKTNTVKFQNGIPGRYTRLAGDSAECISVMLNPTLIDTRPPGSVASTQEAMSADHPDSITLQLRYLNDDADDDNDGTLPESTGGVLPLADYLLIG